MIQLKSNSISRKSLWKNIITLFCLAQLLAIKGEKPNISSLSIRYSMSVVHATAIFLSIYWLNVDILEKAQTLRFELRFSIWAITIRLLTLRSLPGPLSPLSVKSGIRFFILAINIHGNNAKKKKEKVEKVSKKIGGSGEKRVHWALPSYNFISIYFQLHYH